MSYVPPAEYDTDLDAKIDAYHDGMAARFAGHARPADADGAHGWDDANEAKKVRAVMPRRPEGYYHQPIGTFA